MYLYKCYANINTRNLSLIASHEQQRPSMTWYLIITWHFSSLAQRNPHRKPGKGCSACTDVFQNVYYILWIILEHENHSLPSSLRYNVAMRHGNKVDMLKYLYDSAPRHSNTPEVDALVHMQDPTRGMFTIRTLKNYSGQVVDWLPYGTVTVCQMTICCMGCLQRRYNTEVMVCYPVLQIVLSFCPTGWPQTRQAWLNS